MRSITVLTTAARFSTSVISRASASRSRAAKRSSNEFRRELSTGFRTLTSHLMITAGTLHAQFKTIRPTRRATVDERAPSCCLVVGRRILFSRILMKLPDICSDWRIIAGLALIVLGAVNWEIGRARTQEYS